MHIRTVVVLPLALFLSACALAYNGSEAQLRPWQSVRVTAPTAGLDRTRASFFAVRGDSIVFARVASRGQFAGYQLADTILSAVSLGAVTRLEVPTLSWSGALGGIGGMAVGLVIVRHMTCGLDKLSECLSEAIIIPALSGAAGALIGTLLVPGASWEQVPPSSLRVGLGPLPGGRLGLGASVSF